MKAALIAIALLFPVVSHAVCFVDPAGVTRGNVCYNGAAFWVYPLFDAMPIGTACTIPGPMPVAGLVGC